MISADDVIVSLTAAAAEAQAREEAFRADMAVTAKRLETERATAYRRLNFMRTLAHLAASAETPEAAAGAAKAHVRASFGWDTDSEARTGVLEHIAPIATALFSATHAMEPQAGAVDGTAQDTSLAVRTCAEAEEPVAPAVALSAFENWYEQTRASSFWFLFEHYMPETPRVDY